MTGDFRITGTEQLADLGRRFKAQGGGGGLRRQLLARIRKTNKPTIARIRASALSELPAGGGLAERVAASKIGTRTRLSTTGVGVQIRGVGIYNIRRLNSGKLRKPLFGNRAYWYDQDVRPGFFTRPIETDLPRIHGGLLAAMSDIAAKIQKG